MSNKRSWITEIHRQLAIPLSALNFETVSLGCFHQNRGDFEQIILFEGHFFDRYFAVSYYLGVLFPKLEKLMWGKFEMCSPTILTPLHVLLNDDSQYEYRLSSIEEVAEFAELSVDLIRNSSMRFFEAFITLEAVKSAILSGECREMLVLDRVLRIAVPAAIDALTGDFTGSICRIDEAIKSNHFRGLQDKLRLNEFRARITAQFG